MKVGRTDVQRAGGLTCLDVYQVIFADDFARYRVFRVVVSAFREIVDSSGCRGKGYSD